MSRSKIIPNGEVTGIVYRWWFVSAITHVHNYQSNMYRGVQQAGRSWDESSPFIFGPACLNLDRHGWPVYRLECNLMGCLMLLSLINKKFMETKSTTYLNHISLFKYDLATAQDELFQCTMCP